MALELLHPQRRIREKARMSVAEWCTDEIDRDFGVAPIISYHA